MAKLNVNPFEFDSRMMEWNLKHNTITKEQLNTYLASLPDDAANAEALEIKEEAPPRYTSPHLMMESNGSNGSHDEYGDEDFDGDDDLADDTDKA